MPSGTNSFESSLVARPIPNFSMLLAEKPFQCGSATLKSWDGPEYEVTLINSPPPLPKAVKNTYLILIIYIDAS